MLFDIAIFQSRRVHGARSGWGAVLVFFVRGRSWPQSFQCRSRPVFTQRTGAITFLPCSGFHFMKYFHLLHRPRVPQPPGRMPIPFGLEGSKELFPHFNNMKDCNMSKILNLLSISLAITLVSLTAGQAQEPSAVNTKDEQNYFDIETVKVSNELKIRGSPRAPAHFTKLNADLVKTFDIKIVHMEWTICEDGAISSLLESKSVRSIVMVGSNFRDDDIDSLKNSKESLKFINISGCWITGKGIRNLIEFDNIKSIYIENLPLVPLNDITLLRSKFPDAMIAF